MYRFGLPLVVLCSVAHVAHSDSAVELFNDIGFAFVFLVLWLATWIWGETITDKIDVAVATTVWVSLLHGWIQLAIFHSPGAVAILSLNLFWAPVIAVYWGMIFHERWLIGVAQVLLYYVAFLLIDPFAVQAGKSLFTHGGWLALAQGVLLMSMMAIFANINAHMKLSEARWRTAEHRANHDPLTGLLNRSTFSRHLPNIINMAGDGKSELSMMLIDFDHFKSINDRYGHSAGDKILRKVARVFSSSLRVGDSLYRWGGEEFAIILRDTDADTVAAVAERLRDKTAKHYFGLKRPVTVSVGVATYETGESSHSFFKRVDAAMLCAKRNGRNRVEVAFPALKPAESELQAR